MPRSGRLRNFICEYKESPKVEKASFIPPFIILGIEFILLAHAIVLMEVFVIALTSILLFISIIEIFLVSFEIHEQYQRSNFDRMLTIRLDDFVTQKKEKNVKKVVVDFIEKYPIYEKNRNEIYHTTCQILETHHEEKIEKDITDKLKRMIKRRKKINVDDIVKNFIKKYPKYKRYRAEIYDISCKLKSENNKS